MKSTLLLVVLAMVTLNCTDGGGTKKKRPRRTAASYSNTAADTAPQDRTREQWESISDEALKLACMEAHLVSVGPREGLIDTLLIFYGHSTIQNMNNPIALAEDIVLPSTSRQNESSPNGAANIPSASRAGFASSTTLPPPPSVDISALVALEVRNIFLNCNNRHFKFHNRHLLAPAQV